MQPTPRAGLAQQMQPSYTLPPMPGEGGQGLGSTASPQDSRNHAGEVGEGIGRFEKFFILLGGFFGGAAALVGVGFLVYFLLKKRARGI